MALQPELKLLPVSSIRPDPTQARSSYDPVALDSLAATIRDHGMMNPIIVRQRGDVYEIIAGERRYRATVLLKRTEIACFVYPETMPEVETEILSLIENLQRVDLNPIEEARGYKQLADIYDMTQEEIGEKVGKDQALIPAPWLCWRCPSKSNKL